MHIFTRHHHAFLKLLSFRMLMVLAYQIMAVAVGWHIYEITHDTLALGLIGLAEVVPYFTCALFAGHAVDHYCSRRFFGTLAAVALGVNALTLTMLTMGLIGDIASASYWIYGSIMLTGIERAFIAPSYSTLFAIILPREEYARASAIGSSVFQAGLIAGPAIGGLLVGFASKTFAYSMATTLCVAAAIAMWSIKIDEPAAPTDSPSVFTSIGEGLRFVFNNQIVWGALSLDMFAVLFGGAVAMLPAFIHDIYHYGPEGLGILRAAPAIGSIMTGIWLSRNPINLHAGRWLLASVAGFGLCIICFGLSTYIWMAGAMLVLSGIFDGVSVVMRTTILQLATPDAMRGRVSAINGIFIGSSNELGAFESGLAARLLGLVPSVIFGGMMTLGIVAVTAKAAPQLRKLELHQLH
ncbi:MFS transporter [Methylotenera versatilis]|uniref:Major facilitator superfamily MFS_1 n=1 Tax=Methylotenera versatilis (strain 301) TaxID=666681 RepID=D7DP10_METV0|nr:MFS transporter [Methylotenera versatilis]ADI31041.1 major facilitator superfamily MFS_1 [Methylotenera versatilis 301]